MQLCHLESGHENCFCDFKQFTKFIMFKKSSLFVLIIHIVHKNVMK